MLTVKQVEKIRSTLKFLIEGIEDEDWPAQKSDPDNINEPDPDAQLPVFIYYIKKVCDAYSEDFFGKWMQRQGIYNRDMEYLFKQVQTLQKSFFIGQNLYKIPCVRFFLRKNPDEAKSVCESLVQNFKDFIDNEKINEKFFPSTERTPRQAVQAYTTDTYHYPMCVVVGEVMIDHRIRYHEIGKSGLYMKLLNVYNQNLKNDPLCPYHFTERDMDNQNNLLFCYDVVQKNKKVDISMKKDIYNFSQFATLIREQSDGHRTPNERIMYVFSIIGFVGLVLNLSGALQKK